MGVWGFGSDENDSTYDALGMGIAERLPGLKLNKLGRQEMKKHFKDMPKDDKEYPGVVIWYVKQGIEVPKGYMKKVIATLKKEKVRDEDWFDDGAKKRKKEIVKEIKMLEKRILTGKFTRVKVKEIFG